MKLPSGPVNQIIRKYGQEVTITTRIPTDETDEWGHTVYDESESTQIARIKIMKGSEKLIKAGVLRVGDAQAIFPLDAKPYLNEFSSLKLNENSYQMLSPVETMTHIEVSMRRIEL